MNSWIDDLLQTQLDLSGALVSEPGPGLLIAATQMTTTRIVIAAISGLACLGFVVHAVLHRADLWDIVWPHAVMIPLFAVIAIVIGFGYHQKSFDANRHEMKISAHLGPFGASRSYTLPLNATIALTYRLEYPSRAGGNRTATAVPVRWYDVQTPSVPGASFTIPSDRDTARAFAKKLSNALGWPINDQVEDDGVQRIRG